MKKGIGEGSKFPVTINNTSGVYAGIVVNLENREPNLCEMILIAKTLKSQRKDVYREAIMAYYKVKLRNMAIKHNWDNNVMLAELVGGFGGQGLDLLQQPSWRHLDNYQMVAWFWPKGWRTAWGELKVPETNPKELEEIIEKPRWLITEA